MNYTAYHKLQKPLDTEQYDIGVHNANSDILDAALEELAQKNIMQDRALQQIKHDLEQQIIAAVSKVTGVKGNAESAYRTGNVSLTAENIGAVSKGGDTMTGVLKVTNIQTSTIQPFPSPTESNPIVLSCDGDTPAMMEKVHNNTHSITKILAESDILTTEDEIDANTNAKMIVGATVIKSLKNTLSPQLFKTSTIFLNSLDWVESSSGKYYSNIDLPIPKDKIILGIYLNDWGHLNKSDIIQPYININRMIGILSNVNTFSENAGIRLTISYF